jgi:hypothetical protein
VPEPIDASRTPDTAYSATQIARALQYGRAIWVSGLVFGLAAIVFVPALFPPTNKSLAQRGLVGCLTYLVVSTAVELALLPGARRWNISLGASAAASLCLLVAVVSTSDAVGIASLIAALVAQVIGLRAMAAHRRSLRKV